MGEACSSLVSVPHDHLSTILKPCYFCRVEYSDGQPYIVDSLNLGFYKMKLSAEFFLISRPGIHSPSKLFWMPTLVNSRPSSLYPMPLCPHPRRRQLVFFVVLAVRLLREFTSIHRVELGATSMKFGIYEVGRMSGGISRQCHGYNN